MYQYVQEAEAVKDNVTAIVIEQLIGVVISATQSSLAVVDMGGFREIPTRCV